MHLLLIGSAWPEEVPVSYSGGAELSSFPADRPSPPGPLSQQLGEGEPTTGPIRSALPQWLREGPGAGEVLRSASPGLARGYLPAPLRGGSAPKMCRTDLLIITSCLEVMFRTCSPPVPVLPVVLSVGGGEGR